MKKFVFLYPVLSLLIVLGAYSNLSAAENPIKSLNFLSKTFTIDRQYPSMEGLVDNHNFVLDHQGPPQLAWIIGAELQIVDEAGRMQESAEHLCHANLVLRGDQVQRKSRNPFFRNVEKGNALIRLIDFGQGNLSTHFPEHFGTPVMTDDPLMFSSMIFNTKIVETPYDIKVQYTLNYILDKDLDHDMKALFRLHDIAVMVPVEKSQTKKDSHRKAGARKVLQNPGKQLSRADLSYHWLVPPGRHIYRRPIKQGILRLPFDTTTHHIAIHVHPFAEFLELRDLTTKESVFKGIVKNNVEQKFIDQITYFESKKGVMLYKDHDYELVAQYNNPMDYDIDAMAVMYMYLWDKHFDKQLMFKN